MNLEKPANRFVKDGSTGALIALIPFLLLFLLIQEFVIEFMFIDEPPFLGPIPLTMLATFVGTGIGIRFLDSVTSRWGWIKPIFAISVSSFITFIMLVLPIKTAWGGQGNIIRFNAAELARFITLCAAGGFMLASLIGVIFNPATRIFKLVIGSLPGLVIGIGFAILLILMGGQ